VAADDVYRLRFVAHPQVSPDGSAVAYVVAWVDPTDHTRYRSQLMLADIDGGGIDLGFLEEVRRESAAVGLDRTVEVILRERVGRVLHGVGGDDRAVVTVGVGGHQEEALKLFASQPFVREAGAEDDGTIRLYVDRGETAMPAILRLLDGAGLELQTITLTRPSLDDVFLRQTGRSLREVAA